MHAIVLAAGKGTRMISDVPKVLHPVWGRPILGHVFDSLRQAKVSHFHVVVGSGAGKVVAFIKKVSRPGSVNTVLQRVQRGTGHAVVMCERSLKGTSGDLLICPGDMPLLKPETLRALASNHHKSGAEASILSAIRENPGGYGRIIRMGNRVTAIREELDASEWERSIREVNTGVYLFRAKALFKALKKIRPENKKKELYLTDVIEIMTHEGRSPYAFPLASSEEGQGINTRMDLAEAAGIMSQRENQKHMKSGVTVIKPDQTVIEPGVRIGKDTTIYPWTYIESNVKIGRRCKIGPFAKIRSGSSIDDDSIIGSFVEVSRTQVGKGVFAKHLAYLGDAKVGDGSNIGAGTVTANYDGKRKHRTTIGKKNLIGSNTVLVAPVKLGDKVKTGAGAVVVGSRSVKTGETLVGVPAKPLKKKRSRT